MEGLGSYAFDVRALRRSESEETEVPAMGVGIGIRLARLAAEAPVGTRLRIATRARDGRLRIRVQAEADQEVAESRSGLTSTDDHLRHLAGEAAALLDSYCATTDVEACISTREPDRALSAIRLLPRGRGKRLRPAGFLDGSPSDSADWASPRASDAAELARILLRHPHLTLIQCVEPLSDNEIEASRRDLVQQLVNLSGEAMMDVIGTPVRVSAMIVADAEPWSLPLRLREHLRGWFNALDLDEDQVTAVDDGEIMPERLAGGLLRFPATADTGFPGMDVEPGVVPYEGPQSEGRIRLGSARGMSNESIDVRLDDQAMSRHIHIIGESGSGKSTLLTTLALETAAAGQGLLLLDPHGTTVDRVIRELPPSDRERVWVIRCGDQANPVRLNPFAIGQSHLREVVISDMLEVFQALFDPRREGIVGPMFQHTVHRILGSLVAVRGERACLLDVPRVLHAGPLRDGLLAEMSDPELLAFWDQEIIRNRSSDFENFVAWVSAKFTAFASNAAIREILGTGADSFDPVDAIRDNRIILVDLDKGLVGVQGARVLGLLYLLRVWVAALSSEVPHPFTVLVDEAASFSAVTLPSILSEGRKFGLRAAVAHQYMAQLDRELADAIAGSVATRVIFRVGTEDAKELAGSTYPEFGPLDLSSMPQFVAAARIADSGRPIRPFTLTVDHNQRVRPDPQAQQALQEVHERTVQALVEPHRQAQRLQANDLTSRSEETSSGAARAGSFLDDWLARRAGQQGKA